MKKVVDIPDDLLILSSRYIGKERYYANFSELVRDGIRIALSKAKKSGVDKIGTEEFLDKLKGNRR